MIPWIVVLVVVLGLVVGGGGAVVALGRLQVLTDSTRSDDPRCEAVRECVCRAVLARFGAAATPAHARACLAIVAAESPATWDGRSPIIGDAGLPGGPSVGPMQVYRATAVDLGFWTPPDDAETEQEVRDAYALVAADVERCVRWGVAVFGEKLRIAGGNIPDAIRRYNGAGDQARAYQAKVLGIIVLQWGGLLDDGAAV